MDSLAKYSKILEELGKRKSELVISEKLFNLEISAFPKLVEMEEDLKKLNDVYSFYKDFATFMDKSSKTLWSKIDY